MSLSLKSVGIRTRRSTKTSTESAATSPVVSQPALDYPKRNEKITSKQYTFRISVPKTTKRVEVSINEGPWHICRSSVGYWWFDWTQYSPGRYKALVRAQIDGGENVTSEPREFQVEKN